MTVVAVTAVVAVGVLGVALALVLHQHDRLLRERLCDKVVVTLKTGSAFGGVLFEVDDKVVVLRDTQALGAGHNGDHVAVDGELVLSRSDIEYLQRP